MRENSVTEVTVEQSVEGFTVVVKGIVGKTELEGELWRMERMTVEDVETIGRALLDSVGYDFGDEESE
jgi:hypothetical protein